MNVKFKQGLSTNLDSTSIENGSLLYTTDTNKLYIDANGVRNEIGGGSSGMIAKLVGTGELSQMSMSNKVSKYNNGSYPYATTYKTSSNIVLYYNFNTYTANYASTKQVKIQRGEDWETNFNNTEPTITSSNKRIALPIDNIDYIILKKTIYKDKYNDELIYLPKNSSVYLAADSPYLTLTENNELAIGTKNKIDITEDYIQPSTSEDKTLVSLSNTTTYYLEFYRYE